LHKHTNFWSGQTNFCRCDVSTVWKSKLGCPFDTRLSATHPDRQPRHHVSRFQRYACYASTAAAPTTTTPAAAPLTPATSTAAPPGQHVVERERGQAQVCQPEQRPELATPTAVGHMFALAHGRASTELGVGASRPGLTSREDNPARAPSSKPTARAKSRPTRTTRLRIALVLAESQEQNGHLQLIQQRGNATVGGAIAKVEVQSVQWYRYRRSRMKTRFLPIYSPPTSSPHDASPPEIRGRMEARKGLLPRPAAVAAARLPRRRRPRPVTLAATVIQKPALCRPCDPRCPTAARSSSSSSSLGRRDHPAAAAAAVLRLRSVRRFEAIPSLHHIDTHISSQRNTHSQYSSWNRSTDTA
jgi:hypothetical protein